MATWSICASATCDPVRPRGAELIPTGGSSVSVRAADPPPAPVRTAWRTNRSSASFAHPGDGGRRPSWSPDLPVLPRSLHHAAAHDMLSRSERPSSGLLDGPRSHIVERQPLHHWQQPPLTLHAFRCRIEHADASRMRAARWRCERDRSCPPRSSSTPERPFTPLRPPGIGGLLARPLQRIVDEVHLGHRVQASSISISTVTLGGSLPLWPGSRRRLLAERRAAARAGQPGAAFTR